MSAAQMSALRSGMQMVLAWPFPLLLIGAGSTCRASRRSGVRGRGGRLSLVLGVMALAALVLAGCGGSDSDKGTQSSGSQTYTVTVTATGTGAATHTAQFTLTVSS
jgi:hypothetical protein